MYFKCWMSAYLKNSLTALLNECEYNFTVFACLYLGMLIDFVYSKKKLYKINKNISK
jgi:hypothetical protein